MVGTDPCGGPLFSVLQTPSADPVTNINAEHPVFQQELDNVIGLNLPIG